MPLPEVELGTYDPEVRAVLESARKRIDELSRADAVEPARLAEAYGNLGRAALFYLQGELARASLSNAATLDPGEFRWHYYLGSHDHDERRLPEARASLARALVLRPGDGATLIRLGRVLLLLDEPDRAAEAFESARAKTQWVAAALYGLGRCAAQRGEPEVAVGFFEQARELQPEAAEIRQQLAMAYRDAGKPDAARAELAVRPGGELIFPDPLVESLGLEFANSAVYRGLAAQSAGRLEEAAREYRKAVEGDPENSAFRQALGDVLVTLGDKDGAVRELQEAARLDPGDAMVRVSLGRALAQRDGFTTEVAEQFEAAREVGPDLKEARIGLGQALSRLGRFAEAVAEFEVAVRADPDDAAGRLLLGETLLLLNRNEQALEQLALAVESFPDRPQALVNYGIALSRTGNAEGAAEVLRKVIDGDASTRQKSLAHLELAETLDRLGDSATALLHYRSAADLLPEYKPPQLGLARALNRAGRHGEAAETYALVLLVDPDDVGALGERARSLAAAGRVDLAVTELARARSTLVEPSARAEIGLTLAGLRQTAGQHQKAAELLLEVVAEAPDSKDAHFNLAVELGRQGNHDAAIGHLKRVVEIDPEDVEARLVLAQLWAGGGRFAEARSTLEVAHGRLPENLPVARALAYILVGSPDRAVRDPEAALPVARRLYEARPAAEHAALVAAALAGSKRLEEAVEWQTRAVSEAEAEKLPERQLELMRKDLARYKQGT